MEARRPDHTIAYIAWSLWLVALGVALWI